MWQVNKKGPNHGRQFYCCSLPPPGRCDFWAWLSDIRRQRSKQQQQQQQQHHEMKQQQREAQTGSHESAAAGEFVTARRIVQMQTTL